MFKKLFLLALIVFGFSFFNTSSISSVYAEGNIFELQFKGSDTRLIDKSKLGTDEDVQSRRDGADTIQLLVMKIADNLTKFMGVFAFMYIFYTGMSLVIKGGDEEIKAAKSKILWTIFALLAVFLINPLVRTVFFGGTSKQGAGDVFTNPGSAIEAATLGVQQIQGFLGYIEKFVVLIALVMLIISAVKMIFSHSEELKLEEQKKAIMWTAIGFVIILLSKTLVYFGVYGGGVGEFEGGRNSQKVVEEVGGLLKYILGFVASVAVAMIIYGGAKVLFSQEDAKEGKEVIKNVIIGAIIISIAFTLVYTLVGGKI